MKKKDKVKLKETETKLTAKLTETLQSLGFEAGKLEKDVAKAVKIIIKKVSKQLETDKTDVSTEKSTKKKADKKSKTATETSQKEIKPDKLSKAITKIAAKKKADASSRSVSKPDLNNVRTVAITDQTAENKKAAGEAKPEVATKQTTKLPVKKTPATDKAEKVSVKTALPIKKVIAKKSSNSTATDK